MLVANEYQPDEALPVKVGIRLFLSVDQCMNSLQGMRIAPVHSP